MMRVIQRIDFGTIFFFLGILMAVSALQSIGVLASVSNFLDEKIHNIYIINTLIGIF
jgi:Na+/H+ antiporter NhaD/arsenite permease-like protein